MRFALPFAIFLMLVVLLALGLQNDPHLIPSPLIGKPAPSFQLARLDDPRLAFSPEELRGKVWLLNTWASWCLSCREEHPLLVEFSHTGIVPIYGLDYKDRRDAALRWLNAQGNPYIVSAQDSDGRVGIDYGVYGVPETYLIDRMGMIRFKQVGPLSEEILEKKILPLIQELNQ